MKTYQIKPPVFKQNGYDYSIKTPSFDIDIQISHADLKTYRVRLGMKLIKSKLTFTQAKTLATEIYYQEVEKFLVEVQK